VLAKRQEAKGAGDGDAAAAHCADTTGIVLKAHGKKKGQHMT
jgi:hypothetical protein